MGTYLPRNQVNLRPDKVAKELLGEKQWKLRMGRPLTMEQRNKHEEVHVIWETHRKQLMERALNMEKIHRAKYWYQRWFKDMRI